MTKLDRKITALAEEILKRPLSGEEELELYRISDAVGMRDVQSFLYLLLVFKLHEDTMKQQFEQILSLERRLNDKFDEMGALSARIDETLANSIERILGDGAARIGADMGDEIAEKAGEILSSLKEFHTIRGCIVAASVTGVAATLAYWFGIIGSFRIDELSGIFRSVLLLPAGWWMLFSMASYTYFWCFDNWNKVKRSVYYKCMLALQGIVMTILLASML
jgi:hypothetical protein